MPNKNFLIGLALLMWVVFYWLFKDLNLLNQNYYSVNFFNIQLWDAILIKTPENRTIVIDWGNWDELLAKLSKKLWFFERKIDLVILSHEQADHVWGLVELVRRFEIWEVWLNWAEYFSPDYQEFQKILKEKNIQVKIVNENSDLLFEKDLFLDVLYPFENYEVWERVLENNNNTSVIVKVKIWKEWKEILFTWDEEKELEEILIQRGVDLKSDILKSPHHGSRTSSSTGFISLVKPEIAVIQAAKDNRFGHPNQEILDRYNFFWIETLITWVEGDIELRFE